MANDFLDLPLPVLNGPGAAVDVSGLGTPKTIEVVGDFPGATIAVEISEDGGTTFAPLVVFQNGGGQRTVVVVASHMRVRVSGRKPSVPFTANADVGAPAATPLFANLPLPVGNGPGTPVDISTFGDIVTLVVGGSFPGAVVAIEISEDGNTYAPLVSFSGVGGYFTASTTALWIRTNVKGRKSAVPFSAQVDLGAVPITGDAITGVTVQDEGVDLAGNPFHIFDFEGAGVIATNQGGGKVRITIPGGGGIAGINVFDSGAPLVGNPYTDIDFTDGLVASDVAGVATVSAPGLAGHTPGAVLFAGPGGLPDEDPTKFFYDLAAGRLGVGNAAPTTTVDVTGTTRTTNLAITALTIGSLLFAGAGGAVTQDNPNLFYDVATHRLGLGTTTPATPLDIAGIGTAQSFNVANAGSAFYSSADGASAAVAAANTGRLRYNNTSKKWQLSVDTGAYVDIVSGTGAGMAIGNTVTGGTTGSALFVGAGAVLAQDNANFFWDLTNHRLGIGNAAPSTTLDVTGIGTAQSFNVANAGSAFYASADGASAAVSAANTGRLRYNNSTKKWQLSVDTGAYVDIVSGTGAGMAIGNTVTGGTTGSALFVGAGPVLAQDNANFFWDLTNHRLGIGNAAPGTPLDVTGVARATNVTISAMTLGSALFAGTAGAVSQDNANYFYDATNHRLGIGNAAPSTTLDVTGIGTAQSFNVANAGSAFYASADGASAAVSAANTGRLRYNNSTKKWQVSIDTGAYADIATGTAGMAIGGTVTSGTTGSVLFVGAGPVLAQDNATFFWDTTNKRLGIGTASPSFPLHIVRPNPADGIISITNTGTGGAATDGYSDILFNNNSGTLQGAIGFGNATVGITHLRSLLFTYSATNVDAVWANATNVNVRIGMATGAAAITMANGGSVTAGSNLGAIVYSTAIQRFVMSSNNGVSPGISGQKEVALWANSRAPAALTNGLIPFTDTNYNLDFYDTGNGVNDSALYWDNTNKRMGVGMAQLSNAVRLQIRSEPAADGQTILMRTSANTQYADLIWFDNLFTQKGGVGYGDTAVTAVPFRGVNFFYSPGAGVNWVMGDGTTTWMKWYLTTGSFGVEYADGASAAVSTSGTGKLRYNNTTKTFQVSLDGGAYVSLVTL